MRDIFGLLTLFDWVTPVIGIVEDIANDPSPLQTNSHTFWLPYQVSLDNGWNFSDIEKLLENKGIKSWGAQYNYIGDEYFFSVSRDQAQWAEYILSQSGVPCSNFGYAPTEPRKSGFLHWLFG